MKVETTYPVMNGAITVTHSEDGASLVFFCSCPINESVDAHIDGITIEVSEDQATFVEHLLIEVD